MKIRHASSIALVAGFAAGVAGPAFAGAKGLDRTVVVNNAERTAMGHFAGARASADTTQFIRCGTWAADTQPNAPGGIVRTGHCMATDTRGNNAYCFTMQSELIDSIAGMQGDSQIIFKWDAGGQCISIEVSQSSTLEPKR